VDLLGELAALFLEGCPKWLAALGRDLLGGNARGLRFTAHLVRGSVGTFGAAPAGEAARRLEASARAGDLAAAAGAYSALEAALRRLTPALAALAQ
jgi:two-component system, sensor histidine kinase and response regulator